MKIIRTNRVEYEGKIINFLILSRKESKIYKPSKPSILISISGAIEENAEIKHLDLYEDALFLKFEDKDIGLNVFTELDAIQILNLVKSNLENIKLIVVNCLAGISRSAAVGAALSLILNGDDKYFFNNYYPNNLVFRTILNTNAKYNILPINYY
jgi:predicted protein tyrosine phosphatase